MRAFKRAVRRQPELRTRVEHTLQQLAEDPFHPTLHSHKLKGELAGAWACTVDYDNRILFEFVQNPESGAQPQITQMTQIEGEKSVKSVVAEGFQVMILGDGEAEEQGCRGAEE